MSNIFDYLLWRDIPIEKVEFNEIDSLILSRFSYLPLDELIEKNEKITIKECYNRYNAKGKNGNMLMKADLELFPILAKSKRFGNLYVTNYINKIDKKAEKQISAVTILLPNNTAYVCYRGTDDTVVGWKENLNMSFSILVPAQQDAINYLNNVISSKRIIVGGHSKGGNLAIYASVFCNKKIQNKIIDVYSFDGPGFSDKVINSKEYNKIVDKINIIIPQSSIVGRLFEHKGKVKIIKSIQTGIMQHDLYSWEVLGEEFVTSEITNLSEFVDRALTDWLNKVDDKEKKEFVNTLFEILSATQVQKFSEMNSKKISTAKTILKSYTKLDPESKKAMNYALNMFLKVGKENIFIKKQEKDKVI